MENIHILMVMFFMEIGSMIYNLVLDMKYGMILLNIQVNIIMEKKKELVHIFGKIKIYIKVNGKIIIWTDMEYINLQMVENI